MTKNIWRIPLIYIVLGILWILLSDSFTDWLFGDADFKSYSYFQTFKGLFYVLLTGIVLYFLIRNFYDRLLSSETVYRTMFERNPNPMWIYDPRTLNILEVNQAAVEVYGYTQKEFQDLTIADIRPKEDVSKLLTNVKHENKAYQNSGPWQHKTKDGRVFFVRIYSNSLYKDSEQVRLVTAIDIDEMEKAKRHSQVINSQLIDTSNYLRSLIDSESSFLIRMDLKGNLIFGNQKFLKTFNYNNLSVQGKGYSEIFHNEDWRVFQRVLVNCKNIPGDVNFLTLRSLTNDQKVIFTEWEFIGIADENGEVNEIQGVGRNVTSEVKNNQELDRYKKYFGQILSSLNDVVFSVDASDMSLLFINESCDQVTQYTAEEFLQKQNLWREIVLPEDREKFDDQIHEIIDTGEERRFECRVVSRNGIKKSLLFRIRPFFNEQQSRKELHGIFTDITDVRSAQETIKDYARDIEEILKSITEGFFSVDSEGRFQFINQGFEDHTGLNGEKLMGKSLWEVFPRENSDFKEHFNKGLEEKKKQSFEAYHEQFEKWFYFSVYPKNEGLSVYFEDTTESRRAREEIQRSQELLGSVINSTSDLIWAVDKDLKLIAGNEVFQDSLSTPLQEGETVLKEFAEGPGSDILAHWKSLYQKGLNGESFIREEEMSQSTEEFRYLEVRFNPLRNDRGEVFGVSCFGRNVTHHKLLEEQLKNQNMKLREIAHIQSHIVRNPVVNIQGLLKLLDKQQIKSANNAEILKHMENAVRELDDIIHDIVDRANTVERKVKESRENNLLK
ncbi:PAS domain S-box protein [Halocola ammonii]